MKYKFQNNSDRIENLSIIPPRNFLHSNRRLGISVVILNLDKPEYILPLVKKLKECMLVFNKQGLNFEILIGDTGSTHPEVLNLYEDKDIQVIKNLKYHFSKNNNTVAFENSKCEYILFLNNDIIFEDSNLLYNLYVEAKSDPKISIFGHCLYFANETIQHRGIEFLKINEGRDFLPYHIDATKKIEFSLLPLQSEYDATTGAFLMIECLKFAQIRGFSEEYEKEAQDIDLCLKIRRLGFKIKVFNFAKVYHFENGTRKKGEESNFDRSLFVRRWSSFIEAKLFK